MNPEDKSKQMVRVLNIPVYDGALFDAVTTVISSCSKAGTDHNLCISATGAHGLVYSRRNPDFADVLKAFFLNLPDGVPAVWIGKLKGASKMQRCYGPHFFAEVMSMSAYSEVRHFLCGGKEGVAEELKKVCEVKFENRNCVGTFSPPFRTMDDNEMLSLGQMINKSGADIVWIGLSTPKQEVFARRLSEYTKTKFIVTVGAAFDFHAGRVKEAPQLMQRYGLEWLFRLLKEPRRLFKRYIQIVPLFIIYGTVDVLTFYMRKIRGERDVS